MATEDQQEASVLIRLSVIQPGSIQYPERRILLTESEPTAKLGRSSSRPSLGLQPAVTNGWYNSPVMSRHHAELEADFDNETVGITDLGSMHGTFLNKIKVGGQGSQATHIQVGDELTLGLPVFRNREEFHPALMRVDGWKFCKASRQPTTTPTRTFTVPDDCSTDDNEPMDESLDEPEAMGLGTDANVEMVDEENVELPNQPVLKRDTHLRRAERSTPICQPNAGLAHQLDGADDNASSDGGFPRPGWCSEACSEMSSFDGSSICNETAGQPIPLDDITDSEDGDQDMDSLHDIESANYPDTQNASCGEESQSESWDSIQSDSEVEDMGDESALEAAELALFEDDTDEMADKAVVNGKVQPDTSLDSEQQIEHSLQAPSRDSEITRAPLLPSPVPQLPPISSVISTGPNDWMSCSHNNWGPRSPSPSDAVLLPRHCRTDAANNEKEHIDTSFDSSQPVPEVQGGDAADSRSQVEHSARGPERVQSAINTTNLGATDGDRGDSYKNHMDANDPVPFGQKSGKAEFFAARAVNKRVHNANMQIERLSAASPQPQLGRIHVPSKIDCDAEEDVTFANTPELADSSSNFILAPNARGLIGEAKDRDTVQQIEPADSQRPSLCGYDYPYGLEAAAWSSCDPPDAHEPSSAYDLQNLKSKLRATMPLGSASKASRDDGVPSAHEATDHTVQASAEVGSPKAISYTFEQLKHKKQRLFEHETPVLANDSDSMNKGKRKAAEISEASPLEIRWAFSSKDKNEAATSSDNLTSSSCPVVPSTSDQTPLPSPPPSPEEVAAPEQRSTKKIKRIAERVGYAALGGVSVGAMVLTSLIYTAPNFV